LPFRIRIGVRFHLVSYRPSRTESISYEKMGSILQKVCMDSSIAELGYRDPSGELELRRLLAKQLWISRGVISKQEQIIIMNGAVQALQLIVKLLLNDGDDVLFEEPSNIDLNTILTSTESLNSSH
jgi:GntR family transcriptional regulator/MocR family aminotransferase